MSEFKNENPYIVQETTDGIFNIFKSFRPVVSKKNTPAIFTITTTKIET
jgi:hypothetical protein